MNATQVTMTLERTKRRISTGMWTSDVVPGSGFVLFGKDDAGKWFERRFPSEEKARAYAAKRGWAVK